MNYYADEAQGIIADVLDETLERDRIRRIHEGHDKMEHSDGNLYRWDKHDPSQWRWRRRWRRRGSGH